MSAEELLLKIGVQADSRGLTSINAEMRKLQQATKQLNNSLKTSGASLDTYKQKQSNLQRQLELLATKQDKAKKKLNEYNEAIAKNRAKYEELSKAEGEHSEELAKLDAGYQSLVGKANGVASELQGLEVQVRNTSSQLQECSRIVDNFNLQSFSTKCTEVGEKLQNMGDKIQNLGEKIQGAGKLITTSFAPIASAGLLASKCAIDFENSWASVLKTTDGTEKQLNELQNGLLGLSEVIPINVNDLNELAAVGGQLGVPVQNLKEFTKVIAEMGTATNVSSEEAATALAQFANITGMSLDEVENLGSAIVDCGNNFATQESTIIEFAQRLAGVGTTAGLSEQDIIGFSTAMGSLGVTAEAGATSFSTVMSTIDSSVTSGGEKLEEFAKISGMTVEEFKTGWEQDAGQTIVKFLEGLHNIDEQGGDTTKVLTDLFGSGTRIRDVMLRLAGNTNLVSDALHTSNVAWEKNTALQEEADKRYETTASQLEIAKNKIYNLGISIGQQLLPSINKMLDGVGKAVEWFGQLDPKLASNIIKFSTMAVGVGLVTTGIGKLVSGVGGAIKTVGGFVKAIGSLTDVTKTTGQAIVSLSNFTTKLIPGLATMTTTASGGASALGTLATAMLPIAGIVAGVGGAVYTYHEYNEALNDSLLKTSEEMSPLEKGFRKLNDIQIYSKKNLEEMGLVYEDFNKNISKEFQQSVEEMRNDIQEFNLDLKVFSADGIFSDDEVEKLKNRFNEGVQGSIDKIKSRKEEVQQSWSETFTMDDNVIDDSEQTLINFFNKNYDTSISEIEKMSNDVNELFRKRIEEGYQFTSEDEQMIRDYYEKIHQIELECEANNEYEQLYAKNKFHEQVATADAEHASKLGKQRQKQLKEEMTDIKAEYDTKIEMIKANYDRMNEEEKAAADREILDLQAQKEAKVKAKQEEINAIYDEMVAGNENLKGVIDRFTLDVLEGDSKRANDRLNKLKEENASMLSETQTGTKAIYNENKQCWEETTTIVDEATGEITGVIKTWTDENGKHLETSAGYNKKYEQSTQEMATQMVQDYNRMVQKIQSSSSATVNANGQIIGSNGQVIGSIEQVVDANGNLVTSVRDVNGNPINIKDNTPQAINNLQNVANKADSLNGKQSNITVTTTFIEKHLGFWSDTASGYHYNSHGQAVRNEQGSHGGVGARQLAEFNESWRGNNSWELIDGNYVDLGSDGKTSRALLGVGASIKPHATSVDLMRRDIKNEVAKQLQNVYMDYGVPSSPMSQMAFRVSNNVNNSSSFDDKNIIDTLLQFMSLVGGMNMSPNINVNINRKSLAQDLTPYIDRQLEWNRKHR